MKSLKAILVKDGLTEHSFQGEKCHPCVRYKLSPMCQAAQKSADLAVTLIQSRKPQQRRAVVARTMNSGSIIIALGYGIFVGALIRCKRVFAAITPISRSGCRTVVSAGF